jgi:hypothetical protein
LGIPRIIDDLRDSIRFWATGPANVPSPSGARAFDNIAFAGATTEDMYKLTAEDADRTARELAASALAGADLETLVANVGTMLIMANARFTLAPDPELSEANPFRRRTSVEIVAMRQPKRLMVSIGHNDGLINIVLRADPDGARKLTANLRKVYPTLVRELCSLPDTVESIYVNLLPAPSAVSSLMPTSTKAVNLELGRYFESYETLMCYEYGTLTGERLHALDLEMRDLNRWIVDEFHTRDTTGRVHFVDTFAHMKRIDSKNNGRNPTNTFVIDGKTCTNEMFQAHPFPGESGFKAGGLQGLDGVHLTDVGNALVATWVLETIAASEGAAITKPVMALDPLVRNPPNAWSWALFIYRDIMKARAGKPHDPPPPLQAKAVKHSVDIAARVMTQMAPGDGGHA